MIRSVLRCVAAATMGFVVAGLAHAADSPQTLVIGNLLELTGPLSSNAPAMLKASDLAVAEANKAAKAASLGIQVKGESVDVQGDPQAALSAARNLADKGADCMLGPGTTPETIAIAKGVTIQKSIVLFPQATSVKLSMFKPEANDTIFRTVPPDNLQSGALAEAAVMYLGSAKDKLLSVAYRNEPYGEGLGKDVIKAWTAKGGKVQGPIVFNPDQATYDAEAEKIVAGNPDAYAIIDYPDTFVKMGAALLRTGKFDAEKLFVPDTLSFTEVPKNIPEKALDGARGVRAGVPEGTEAYKAFDDLWKKAGGAEHFSLDANTFDAGLVCFLAAVAAKSTEPAAIKSHIRSVADPKGEKYTFLQLAEAAKAVSAGKPIAYVGVSGPLEFDKNGDPTTSLYDIFQLKGGRLAVLRQIQLNP